MQQQSNNNNGGNGRAFASSGMVTSDSSISALPQNQRAAVAAAAAAGSSGMFRDLAQAIQMANLANNRNSDPMYQYLQQLGLQALQQMKAVENSNSSQQEDHQANNTTNVGSTASMITQQKNDTTATETSTTAQSSSQQHTSDSSKSQSGMTGSSDGGSGSGNQMKRNTIIVPCRARGMSMKHNFQTAYFEIPENIKHGDGLICSFPACRNRGVKFLYCSFCQDPVAKRNFRSRHTHGQANEKGEDGKLSPAEMKEQQAVDVGNLRRGVDEPEEESDGGARPPIGTINMNQQSEGSGSGSGLSLSSSAAVANTTNKRPSNHIVSSTDEITKRAKLDTRKEAWEFLLMNRPETANSDEMSAWLMHVMAVSDPNNARGAAAQINKMLAKNEESLVEKSGSTATSTEMDGTINDSTSTLTGSRNGTTDSSSSSPTDGSSNTDSNEDPLSLESSTDNPGNNSSNDSNDSSTSCDNQDQENTSNDSSSDNQEHTGDSSSETQDQTGT